MSTGDRAIAEKAVGLLLSVGCYGLDRSKERQLWQEALDLDRALHPDLPRVIVWSAEEGDVDPPRHPDLARCSGRAEHGKSCCVKD